MQDEIFTMHCTAGEEGVYTAGEEGVCTAGEEGVCTAGDLRRVCAQLGRSVCVCVLIEHEN